MLTITSIDSIVDNTILIQLVISDLKFNIMKLTHSTNIKAYKFFG